MMIAVFQQPNASYHATSRAGQVPTGPRGVALHDLVAARQAEVLGAGDSLGGGGAVRPVVQQRPQVGQRVAERRHVPVEDRGDLVGVTRGELAVVDLEVVVDQGGLAGLGQVPGQQLADPVHGAAARRSRPPPSGAASPGPAGPGSPRGGRGSRGRSSAGSTRCRSASASTTAKPMRRPGSGPTASSSGTRSQTTTPGRYSETRKWAPMTGWVGAVVHARAGPAGTPRATATARCTRGACRASRPRSRRRAAGGRRGRPRRTGPGRSGWPSRSGTAAPRSRPRGAAAAAAGAARARPSRAPRPDAPSATSGRSTVIARSRTSSLIRCPAAPRPARGRPGPDRRRPRRPAPGGGSSAPGAPR